jgi:poly-beta-1,6-N-acetyl-D-glucosamine synthase
MALATFWFSLGFLAYVYVGYPLILMVWKVLAPRRVLKGAGEPTVTLIVAAHNERNTLDAKLANCLDLDYPRRQLQIIVSLDGPTDGTEHIARRYEPQDVTVLLNEQHRGKAAAINVAASRARGEILIFVDARQRLERDSLRRLVANFHDDAVGAVSGELVIDDDFAIDHGQPGEAVGLYWRYEKCLRKWESEIHSVVGSTGALHAIRRELFRPLPEDTILDDVAIPMTAVLGGKRVVFEALAKAHDKRSSTPQEEFGRKVRTLTGNFQLIALMPWLLRPSHNKIFFQFVSHKLARLIAPYVFLTLYVSNIFLPGRFYRGVLLLQTAWYVLAVAGHQISSKISRESSRSPMYSPHRVGESE